MDILFDDDKDRRNKARHGVSLAFGVRVLADPRALISIDLRFDYGEERLFALGMVDGTIWVCVHVALSDVTVRIISVRKATREEADDYYTTPR